MEKYYTLSYKNQKNDKDRLEIFKTEEDRERFEKELKTWFTGKYDKTEHETLELGAFLSMDYIHFH